MPPINDEKIIFIYGTTDKFNALPEKDENSVYFIEDTKAPTENNYEGKKILIDNNVFASTMPDTDLMNQISSPMSYYYPATNSGKEYFADNSIAGINIDKNNVSNSTFYFGTKNPSWKITPNKILNDVTVDLTIDNNVSEATAHIEKANSTPDADYTGGLQGENINLLNDSISIGIPSSIITDTTDILTLYVSITNGTKLLSILEKEIKLVINPYILISTTDLSSGSAGSDGSYDGSQATIFNLMSDKSKEINNTSGYLYIYVPSRLNDILKLKINEIIGGYSKHKEDNIAISFDSVTDSFVQYKTDYDSLGNITFTCECNFT